MVVKKKQKRPEPQENHPPCFVEGCAEPGAFKAPLAPNTPGQYRHLCLEHVRQFNQAWDFFAGWNQKEIEAFMHSSVHGHRPTWSINELSGNGRNFTPEALTAALHRMMGEAPPPPPRKPETAADRKRREALATLNLEEDASPATIKSQYKKLVKQYHPDVNSSQEAVEQFKRITEAYELLFKQKRD